MKILKENTLSSKTTEFLIIYAIINLYFFLNIYTFITNNNIHLFITNGTIDFDGADFSIFANILGSVMYVFMFIINLLIFFALEFVAVIIFKAIFFNKNMVTDNNKLSLVKYIKRIILFFILLFLLMSIIVNIIIRNISIIEFCVSIILYFSLPLVTYHFFTSNIKKCIVK